MHWGTLPPTRCEGVLGLESQTLSTTPHKRGIEIMRRWSVYFHIWPSLRRQRPSTVAPDVACQQNRQSVTVCAARSKTTARLGSSTSNGRAENARQSVDA